MPVDYPQHPYVAVGAVVFQQNKVLLVKRGNPPALNEWSIPGGVVKLGETLQQAAEREIYEETKVVIRAGDPIYVFDVITRDDNDRIQFHYVIVDVLAEYVSGFPQASDDALDAAWLSPADLKTYRLSDRTRQLLKERFDYG